MDTSRAARMKARKARHAEYLNALTRESALRNMTFEKQTPIAEYTGDRYTVTTKSRCASCTTRECMACPVAREIATNMSMSV